MNLKYKILGITLLINYLEDILLLYFFGTKILNKTVLIGSGLFAITFLLLFDKIVGEKE